MQSNTPNGSLHSLAHVLQTIFPEKAHSIVIQHDATLAQGWESLCNATGTDSDALVQALAKQLGHGIATKQDLVGADPHAVQLVPEALARTTGTLPLAIEGNELVLACTNPLDADSLQRVRLVTNRPLKLRLSAPADIARAIQTAYAQTAEKQSAAMLAADSTQGSLATADLSADVADGIAENAVVKLARGLLSSSIQARASDLHIQPHAGGGLCRIRVDGVLRRVAFLPDATLISVIRFFKVNAGMDSANRLIAQDGRMSIRLGSQAFDLRLSVLPASRGERLVIRFLEQGKSPTLAKAGFSTANLHVLRRLMSHPNGVVLLTGPTGSGKTSTLYAFISEVNQTGINILTVENPVEYRVAGISQVEVNPKAGLTFASALRSILRQDPDVVLIGEIRDQETAEIAMQASLTGRLVLSTLHTNNALGAIPRLVDLGVSAPLIADAVRGIVGQRLFRQLCTHCRAVVSGDLTPDEQAFVDVCGERPLYRSIGCEACEHQGYQGRFPVMEVLEVLPALASRIRQGELSGTNVDPASISGFAPMAHTAALRIVSGDTTVTEAVRVLGPRFWADAAAAFGRPPLQHVTMNQGFGRDISNAPDVLVFSQSKSCANEWARCLQEDNFRPLTETRIDRVRQALAENDTLGLLVLDLDTGAGPQSENLLLQLREAAAWARLPAVLVLAAGDTKTAHILAEHGFVDALFKPVDSSAVAQLARLTMDR